MTGEEYSDWYCWNWLEGRDYHAKRKWDHKVYPNFDCEKWEKRDSGNAVTKPTEDEYYAEFFFHNETGYSMYQEFRSIESLDRCIKELKDLRKAWMLAEISKRIPLDLSGPR